MSVTPGPRTTKMADEDAYFLPQAEPACGSLRVSICEFHGQERKVATDPLNRPPYSMMGGMEAQGKKFKSECLLP